MTMISTSTTPPGSAPPFRSSAPPSAAAEATAAFAEWMGLGIQADQAAAPAGAGAESALDALAETADPATDDLAAAATPQDGAPLPAMAMPHAPPAATALLLPAATPVALTTAIPAAIPAALPSAPRPAPLRVAAGVAGATPAGYGDPGIGAAGLRAAPAEPAPVAARLPSAALAATPVSAPAQPVAAADPGAIPAPLAIPVGFHAVAPAPAASDGAAAGIKLAGAPATWQQPLLDALGERLQLQLGRNSDQAVIRLDPPMLGRIEIAIRHAAGTLEVNLSATHGEVLRQLHAISDSMRSDLAQRQFSEVAVTVTAAPRSPAAAPFGEPQGRQRQPGREQAEADPGQALAEAGLPASAFSLTGRESYT